MRRLTQFRLSPKYKETMTDYHPKSILLIEDDHDNRVALRMALEECGYQVQTAANGCLGLQILDRGVRPGVSILDMMMPIMDGEEFLERLKPNE